MCCLVSAAGGAQGRTACKSMTSFQGRGACARRHIFCIHFLEAAGSVAESLDVCRCCGRALSAGHQVRGSEGSSWKTVHEDQTTETH